MDDDRPAICTFAALLVGLVAQWFFGPVAGLIGAAVAALGVCVIRRSATPPHPPTWPK